MFIVLAAVCVPLLLLRGGDLFLLVSRRTAFIM
jgi:hypothetical protein